MLEVKELVKLRNLRIHHVTIRSELRDLIGTKVAGTRKWNRGPGSIQPKNCGFMSSPGNNPTKTLRFGLLGSS